MVKVGRGGSRSDWVEKFKDITSKGNDPEFEIHAAVARRSLGSPAQPPAQQPAAGDASIAVPPLTTPDDKPTSAGSTLGIAWQATQLIASDLRTTAEMMAIPPDAEGLYSFPEVTAPSFSKWRAGGAKLLLTGFVQARPDGRLTFGCYVYDVDKGRELGRKGFVVAPDEWRRAAHKCSGLAYTAATGAPGIFDTPDRLCRRNRHGRREGQAHRGHGQRRHRASLCDRRRHDGADPAAVAQGGAARLRQLCRRPAAGARRSTSDPARSARWSRSTR